MTTEKKQLMGTFKKNRWTYINILLAALAALLCLALTPIGFDPQDTGNLLYQYSLPLNHEVPVSLGFFLTIITGRTLYSLMPDYQLLLFSGLAWVVFWAECILVFFMLKDRLNHTILILLLAGSIFINKFFDLLGYNNWMVFFFIVQIFFLWKNFNSHKSYWLLLAGIAIGVSTGFRLPNILQAFMILGVGWYYLATQNFKTAFKKCCMYGAAAFVSYAAILGTYWLTYGKQNFITQIGGYIGLSTNSATGSSAMAGYGALDMVSKLLNGLLQGLFSLAVVLGVLVSIAFVLYGLFKQQKCLKNPRVQLFLCVLLGSTAGIGIFALLVNRSEPLSIATKLPPLCFFAAFCFAVSLTAAFYLRKQNPIFSTLCVFAVGMVCIVPLGTNNGSLFFMMGMSYTVPVAFTALCVIKKSLEEKQTLKSGFAALPLIIHLVSTAVFVSFMVISGYTMLTYEYSDNIRGVALAKVELPVLKGMRTTPERNAMYGEFVRMMQPYQTNEVLIYGSFPIGYCLMDLQPYLPQIWMDLDSYDIEKMQKGITEKAQIGELPVIVFAYTWGADYRYNLDKWNWLENFAQEQGYTLAYESEQFKLYVPPKK